VYLVYYDMEETLVPKVYVRLENAKNIKVKFNYLLYLTSTQPDSR